MEQKNFDLQAAGNTVMQSLFKGEPLNWDFWFFELSCFGESSVSCEVVYPTSVVNADDPDMLVGEFRKIFKLPRKLSQPCFLDRKFRSKGRKIVAYVNGGIYVAEAATEDMAKQVAEAFYQAHKSQLTT